MIKFRNLTLQGKEYIPHVWFWFTNQSVSRPSILKYISSLEQTEWSGYLLLCNALCSSYSYCLGHEHLKVIRFRLLFGRTNKHNTSSGCLQAGDRSEDDGTIRESLNNKPSKSKPSTKTPIKPSNKPSTKQSSNSKPASNKVRRQSQVADNSPTLSDDDNDETISDQVLLSIKDVSVSIAE